MVLNRIALFGLLCVTLSGCFGGNSGRATDCTRICHGHLQGQASGGGHGYLHYCRGAAAGKRPNQCSRDLLYASHFGKQRNHHFQNRHRQDQHKAAQA